MALWDALSGKIYRWNKTKDEAFEIFLKNMRLLQADTQANCPEGMGTFLEVRNFEMACYSASQTCFSNLVGNEDFEFRENLYALNEISMNLVIADLSFHFKFIRYSKPEDRDWLSAMAFFMKNLYSKSDSYLQSWLETIGWQGECDDGAFVTRYNHKLYEEIAPLLGLPSDTMGLLTGGMYWGDVSLTIAKVATYAIGQPGWHKSVEDWMAGRR